MNIGAKQKMCLLTEKKELGLEIVEGSSLTKSHQKPGGFINMTRSSSSRVMC